MMLIWLLCFHPKGYWEWPIPKLSDNFLRLMTNLTVVIYHNKPVNIRIDLILKSGQSPIWSLFRVMLPHGICTNMEIGLHSDGEACKLMLEILIAPSTSAAHCGGEHRLLASSFVFHTARSWKILTLNTFTGETFSDLHVWKSCFPHGF